MNHGRVKASHCRKSQDGRHTPYSSITITARSLGSCLLCRHVGTCVFAKGTFNLKTDRLWLFLPPYTSDCLSVESFHICFFLFSYFIRRCWEFTHSSVSCYISQIPRCSRIQDLLEHDTYSHTCRHALHWNSTWSTKCLRISCWM